MIYGPLAHTVKNTSELNESTARIYNNFVNSKKEADLPPDGLYLYADVRDVAAAHIASVFTPGAGGNRFLVSARQISSQQIADTLRAAFPELEERTPKGNPGSSSLPVKFNQYDADSAKTKNVLGIVFRPVEDTLRDLGAQLLELEKSAT